MILSFHFIYINFAYNLVLLVLLYFVFTILRETPLCHLLYVHYRFLRSNLTNHNQSKLKTLQERPKKHPKVSEGGARKGAPIWPKEAPLEASPWPSGGVPSLGSR